MNIFADDAFACFIMEQEGIFDCRSRQEKIEDVIQGLAATNLLNIDIHLLEQICECNHLYDASVSEIAYIVEETNRIKEFI